MTPPGRAIAALGMLAALSGCSPFRVTAIRADALPAVIAAAKKNTRAALMAPDPGGSPVYVDTGFHAVEVRDVNGDVEVYRAPVGASFEGQGLLVQTWNQTRRYTPRDIDRVRLRYERAGWAKVVGTLSAVLGAATSVAGLAVMASAGGSRDPEVRGYAGLAMLGGGFVLNIVGVVVVLAGPDESPPVWPPEKPPLVR